MPNPFDIDTYPGLEQPNYPPRLPPPPSSPNALFEQAEITTEVASLLRVRSIQNLLGRSPDHRDYGLTPVARRRLRAAFEQAVAAVGLRPNYPEIFRLAGMRVDAIERRRRCGH